MGSGNGNAPLLVTGFGTMYHSQNTVLPAWESGNEAVGHLPIGFSVDGDPEA
jgi:hypothetical protein